MTTYSLQLTILENKNTKYHA